MTDWSNNKWQIDERRRHERTQQDKSWEHWNWVFHEGWWYPKLGRWEIAKKHERLMNLEKYGTDDLIQLLESQNKVTCEHCGKEFANKYCLDRHCKTEHMRRIKVV